MRPLVAFFIVGFVFCYVDSVRAQTITSAAGPHLLVYKTRANYRDLVPVILSENKKLILSYPDPRTLKDAKAAPLPTLLRKGYLLDNRGISKNVAFLKMTYAEYSKLSSPPSIPEMMAMIIDKDPLTSLCDCGGKREYPDPVKELNKLIDKKELKRKCKTLK